MGRLRDLDLGSLALPRAARDDVLRAVKAYKPAAAPAPVGWHATLDVDSAVRRVRILSGNAARDVALLLLCFTTGARPLEIARLPAEITKWFSIFEPLPLGGRRSSARPERSAGRRPRRTPRRSGRPEDVLRALEECNWVIAGPAGAAAKLCKRTSLQHKMQKLGIARN